MWNEEDEEWVIEDSRSTRTVGTASTRTSRPSSTSPTATRSTTRYHTHGILGFTPEGSEPLDENVSGFEFQDDEDDVQAEFQRHLLFALDLAESAADPANPSSHLGNDGRGLLRRRRSPYSYGDPQAVEVTAQALSSATSRLRYRINGGTVAAGADQGGDRAASGTTTTPGVYYHRLRGEVKGTKPGDEVEVWFEGRRRDVAPLHLQARSARRGDKVLILSAENYTAGAPAQDPTGRTT